MFPPETKAVIGPGQRSCSFQKPTFMTFHGEIILVIWLCILTQTQSVSKEQYDLLVNGLHGLYSSLHFVERMGTFFECTFLNNCFTLYTEYNASCKVKEQRDRFETISHDFRNIFDKWLSHGVKTSIKMIHVY